jgi:hypothetical protein
MVTSRFPVRNKNFGTLISFKYIYLRCQLFCYWIEVSNEATLLMCKSVETVYTMVCSHATVADTTKWQNVNCNRKSA